MVCVNLRQIALIMNFLFETFQGKKEKHASFPKKHVDCIRMQIPPLQATKPFTKPSGLTDTTGLRLLRSVPVCRHR